MSRGEQLRDAIDRCQDRVRYAQREFDRFCGYADLSTEPQARQHRKLKADLERAQHDVAWLQYQLERALDVEGLTL